MTKTAHRWRLGLGGAATLVVLQTAIADAGRGGVPSPVDGATAATPRVSGQRQVLLLSTDDLTRPWVQHTVNGFRDALLAQPNPPALFLESLDASRFEEPSYRDDLRRWLARKYAGRTLDVIVPLSRPALTVVALFTFMGSWNDFLGPLIYLVDQQTFTLSLGLSAYQTQHGGTFWNLLMAASCLVVLPVLVVFFFAQRVFIQGIATSGLK